MMQPPTHPPTHPPNPYYGLLAAKLAAHSKSHKVRRGLVL
jgi:hypothetical protein